MSSHLETFCLLSRTSYRGIFTPKKSANSLFLGNEYWSFCSKKTFWPIFNTFVLFDISSSISKLKSWLRRQSCHNPNSTSTQTQLNSTELGLTRKWVCAPPHPPTHPNSTSTTRSLRSTLDVAQTTTSTSRITITTKTASTSTTITTTTTKTKKQNNLKTIGLFLPSFKESS